MIGCTGEVRSKRVVDVFCAFGQGYLCYDDGAFEREEDRGSEKISRSE